MDKDTNKDPVDYIRANRQLYTREAIDEKLRAGGYVDADIGAAWEEVLGAYSEPRREWLARGLGCSLSAVVVTALLVGIGLLALTNLGLALRGGFTGNPPPEISALQWFVNLGSLVVLVALCAGSVWLVNRKGWTLNQLAGLVAVVALVWYLIVVGTCFYGPQLV